MSHEEEHGSSEDEDYDPEKKPGKRARKERYGSEPPMVESSSAAHQNGRPMGRARSQLVGDPLAALKTEARAAKINSLWEQLNKPKEPVRPRMGSLPSQLMASAKAPAADSRQVPAWMVSLGLAQPRQAGMAQAGQVADGSRGPKVGPPSDRMEKAGPPLDAGAEAASPTDGGVKGGEPSSEGPVEAPSAAAAPAETSASPAAAPSALDPARPNARAVAAAALAAARALAEGKPPPAAAVGKVEITEVRDFAGEFVKVTRTVDANSKAADAMKRKAEATSKSGLDALLQQLEKKKKLNVLDKSRKDWGEYKEDKGVVTELEDYKKSEDRYTEKVAFLKRAELREYEVERDQRLAAGRKKPTSFANAGD